MGISTTKLTLLRAGAWLPAILMICALVVPGTELGAQEVCEGYTGDHVVSRFAGPHAFSKKKVETLEDLQAVFMEHEPDVWAVLKAKGLESVGDAVFNAIKTGNGVREVQIAAGDTADWMAFRKGGEPMVIDKVCVAPKPKRDRTWAAFLIEVTTESKPDCNTIERSTYHFVVPKVCSNLALARMKKDVERLPPIPPPVCKLSASRSCDASRTLSADTTGSSDGATVTLGGQTVIPSTPPFTWTGADKMPYDPATFTVQSENRDRCGNVQRCEESVTVKPCQRASCNIMPSATEMRSSQRLSVNVDGHWAPDGLQVGIYRGDKQVRDLGGSFPAEDIKLKAGTYTLRGTATNALGDTESCNEPTVEVRRRWTLRPVATYWDTDESEVSTAAIRTGGVSERTKLKVGGAAAGLGLGLEYHINEKIGLEGEIQYVSLDSSFMLDLDEAWGMEDEELESFAFFFGPNFHLTPNSSVDFFVSPIIGLIDAGDADFETLGETVEAEVDTDIAFGLKLGLDIPFSSVSSWGFHLDLRYLDLSGEAEHGLGVEDFDIDFDPIVFSAGLAYSF